MIEEIKFTFFFTSATLLSEIFHNDMENQTFNFQKKSNLTAAAYCRISTLLNQTTDNQLTPIREFCSARGFALTPEREYFDQGISGAKERRPGLDQLMTDARRGKFKFVIVAALDRFGRNVKHLLTVLDELNALGVKFISLRENIDLSTPQGQLIMTVLAAFSQLEREITRQRIREALAARKFMAAKTNSGWRCGRPNKVTSDLRETIFSLRASGLSIRGIVQQLDNKVGHSTVAKVLTSCPQNPDKNANSEPSISRTYEVQK